MTRYDTVVRGGLVCDGLGGEPRRADVAIASGRIAEVGDVGGDAALVIDATGRLVTPGFVDIHTHLDAQLFWDPIASSSCYHGVTTVVLGNCGVTFAPCRPEERGYLARLMESVEDIPAETIMGSLAWGWETYGEYLDAVDALPTGVNVAGMIGHCALRYYVMGERSLDEEPATARDIEQMQELVAEALDRGAVGFSTSRSYLHQVPDGRPVPGTYATPDELLAIADVLAGRGVGTIEVVPRIGERDGPDRESTRGELAWMTEASIRSGRPVSFAITQSARRPGLAAWVMEQVAEARARGADLRPQTAPRAVALLFSLASHTPYEHVPAWTELAAVPWPQRLGALREPRTRRRLVEEAEASTGGTGLWSRDPDLMYVMVPGRPRYDVGPDDSLAAHARRMGVAPAAAFIELTLQHAGNLFLYYPVLNQDFEAVAAMLSDPSAVLGLSDAGAHVSQSMDAGHPTFFLAYWVREQGAFGLGDGVRRLTSEPAELFGLRDRGVLRAGAVADLNVIDWDHLHMGELAYATDFPGGVGRLVQGAHGYDYTLVNGEVFMDHGVPTAARAGRVARPTRAA